MKLNLTGDGPDEQAISLGPELYNFSNGRGAAQQSTLNGHLRDLSTAARRKTQLTQPWKHRNHQTRAVRPGLTYTVYETLVLFRRTVFTRTPALLPGMQFPLSDSHLQIDSQRLVSIDYLRCGFVFCHGWPPSGT